MDCRQGSIPHSVQSIMMGLHCVILIDIIQGQEDVEDFVVVNVMVPIQNVIFTHVTLIDIYSSNDLQIPRTESDIYLYRDIVIGYL